MAGRDPGEEERASTPLELLFDLSFVVAVSAAASALHHDLAGGHVEHGLVSYLVVFFAIWWPWVNFTWFASAYDTDDVPYRLLTFLQITGVLIVTAGVPSAFDEADFRIMVVGYVVMRIALVGQWLRAAREDPVGAPVARRYALGITLVQLGWAARLAVAGTIGGVAFAVLAILELAVPVWAERGGRPTPWHPRHIAERYGLFTIIVLGECMLATSVALQAAVVSGGVTGDLLLIAAGGLLLVFGLWWSYFKHPAAIGEGDGAISSYLWGYGHYVIFAAVAAMGAGLAVAVDTTIEDLPLSAPMTALTVAVPVVAFLAAAGILHARPRTVRVWLPFAVFAPILLAIALSAGWIGVPLAILAMGILLAIFVAYNVAAMHRAALRAAATIEAHA